MIPLCPRCIGGQVLRSHPAEREPYCLQCGFRPYGYSDEAHSDGLSPVHFATSLGVLPKASLLSTGGVDLKWRSHSDGTAYPMHSRTGRAPGYRMGFFR